MLLGTITLPVIRPSAAGQYVKGRWQDAASNPPFNIVCSVQPVGAYKLNVLMQGHRINSAIEIITDTKLNVTDPLTGVKGDMITYDGFSWEIIEANPWQNGLINHYEYVAGRDKEGT